jgi:4-amino-4-deoxy-L-arabinose transferase-like glycosyltransferase
MAVVDDGAGILERLTDRLSRSRVASGVAIVVVALLCFLPGFFAIPPLDGDEPAFAVAAREMAATGDYATVRLQTEDAELKPRGIYWIDALLAGLAGGDPPIWVYRLPSLLGATAACLATWWTALVFGRPRAALLSGWFLAGAGVLGLQARLATPDAILLAAIMVSAGALARVWVGGRGSPRDLPAGLFWTGLGITILAKGIVGPAVIAATVLVLTIERSDHRWLARLRPAVGLTWLFVLLSPWLIAVVLSAMQGAAGGPGADFLSRIGVPFALNAPPGTYTLLVPLLAGPAVTYFFLGLMWIAANLRRPVVLFCLALGAPLWFVAELISAKMPQNILPAVPVIAILAAVAVDEGTARITGKISWFYSLGPVIWPPAIAVIVPIAFYLLEGSFPWAACAAFLVGAFLGPVAWVWLRHGRMVASAAMSVMTAVFIYLGLFGAILPGFSSLRVAERVAAIPPPCREPVFAVAGYPEESMVLVLGRETRIVDGSAAADFLNSAGCRIAAVDRSAIASFRQRADDLGLVIRDRDQIKGFNPRKMRSVEIHLFVADSGAD